jgi:hypothetical protein
MNYSSIFKRALGLSLIVGFLCVGAVGCESDDDNGGNNSGTGGASGTGGTGGATGGTGGATGGTGGTGGATGGTGGMGGGSGGMGGMPAPMPIMCGTNTCNPVMSLSTLAACCMPDMSCGLVTGGDAANPVCTQIGQEGEADTNCPSEPNALSQMTPGCCKPSGKCGLLSMTLMGCVERTEYPARFLESQMALTNMIDCTPGAGDDDAGM